MVDREWFPRPPWWKPALIGLNAGVAVLYVASVALFLITTYGKKKEEK